MRNFPRINKKKESTKSGEVEKRGLIFRNLRNTKGEKSIGATLCRSKMENDKSIIMRSVKRGFTNTFDGGKGKYEHGQHTISKKKCL